MEESNKKRSRTWVGIEHFDSAKRHLNITEDGVLAQHLGYTKSATSRWRREHRMPKAAALACEGLVRRQGTAGREDSLLIVKMRGSEIVTARNFAHFNTMTIEGKTYALVPWDDVKRP